MRRKRREGKKALYEVLESAFKIQDIYEHVSDRESVFVEIPSKEFFVPRMTEKEIKDFEKTGLHKFYRGVYPNVIYVDNKIAFPVNSSLLQPYYQYLRYLVSTEVSVWAYAIPLTSQELGAIYKAVFGRSLDLSDFEQVLESLDESFEEESLGVYEMGEWREDEELGGDRDELEWQIRRLFEDKNVRSIYFSQILSPSKKFFQSYFRKYPAGKFFMKGDDSLYGRVPVLSGHTGIAKSAFVKKLEDPSTDENLVSINFGDDVVLQMRPEVVIFKTGSIAYRELEEAIFAISKIGGGGAEYLTYQTPFFEKFFRASDQFRYFARKSLLALIKGKTEDGKEIPEELRVFVNEKGLAVHGETGVVLEDVDLVRKTVKEGNKNLKIVSLIYNAARPAVLFLDELDRNHALLVRNLTTSFIFNRSFQDELTFYSTYIVAAWNRVAPSERDSLSSFYITAKTVSGGSVDLDEGAFMARFEEVYLDPASEEVYRPVVDYLVERFEGRCEDRDKLCGVKDFLEVLARTEITYPTGSRYNLLYYIPGLVEDKYSDDPSLDEEFHNQKLKGFATFRSYERLLKYLSKKKSEKNPKDRVINLTFVRTLLGYLFPVSKDEVEKPKHRAIKTFGRAFSELIEKNFGYNPYDPGKELSEEEKEYLYDASSDIVLRESVYSNTPVALYGPPGMAKTSKAEALVWKLNSSLFERIRRDEDFRKEVVRFLKSYGYRVSDNPEEVISTLASKVLVIRVGSELMSNPNVISGSNAPMPLVTHPIIKEVMDILHESAGKESLEFEALKSLVENSISSIISGGEGGLVKVRVPRSKTVLTERFLSTFKESKAVLILDEFTRADFVTQGSFFDALSERIIGGHIFPEESFERVQVVATGNYSSSLFGTSVSEIDGALVARFANFFQEEPTKDDVDSYLQYFVESVLKTVDLEKADPKAVEDFRSYVLGKREGEGGVDLRDLLFSMFYVSGRASQLREFRETLVQQWEDSLDSGEVELRAKAPFPSPREISHFFLNRLLPLWLPQSAMLHSQDSGVVYETLEDPVALVETRASELSKVIGNNKILKNPYELAKRLFHAGLGVIPRYPVPGISRALFHPFSGLVFIPKVSKEAFPKLYEALKSADEAKNLFGLDFQPYDSIVGSGLPLRVGDRDYTDYPFYLADSYLEIERSLANIPWDKLSTNKETEEEVVLFSKLMVLAPTSASGGVYEALFDLIQAVKDDKIMFFPGEIEASTRDYELWKESVDRQKKAFLKEAFEIYRRYSNIKLSEALTRTKKVVTGVRVYDLLLEDVEAIKKILVTEDGTDNLESLYEIYSSTYLRNHGEINNEAVYSEIASKVLTELDSFFRKRYGLSLNEARIILENVDQDEESDLSPEIQEALQYARLVTGSEGLANLRSLFSPSKVDSDVVRNILSFVASAFGPGGKREYYLNFSQAEIESGLKKFGVIESSLEDQGYISEYLLKYVREKVSSFLYAPRINPSVDTTSIKIREGVPFLPKLGIIAPGNVTLFGGVPLVPSLGFEEEVDLYQNPVVYVPSSLQSSLFNLYYYDEENKTVYLASVEIKALVRDMSFKKDTERIVKDNKVVIKHKSEFKVVFDSGITLVVDAVSEDPVEPFAVELAKEVVQSEEFRELLEESKSDPYVSSVINDVLVLAGEKNYVRVFSSSNPKETTDVPEDEGALVVLPRESMVYWIKANNYLLSSKGDIPDSTLQAIRNLVRSREYLDRYLPEFPVYPLSSLKEPSVSSDVHPSKKTNRSEGDDLDFDRMFFGDEDMEDKAKPIKAKGVDEEVPPEELEDGSSDTPSSTRAFTKGSPGSSRAAITYITLLRRAIALSRQALSRSV